MFDQAARDKTLAIMGTVLSRADFGFIDYTEPLTVGIFAWSGLQAVSLLNTIDPNLAGVDSELAGVLKSKAGDASYWNTRWLAMDEGATLIPLLTSAKGVDAQKKMQAADLDAILATAKQLNVDPDKSTEAVQLFAVLTKISSADARRVIVAAAGDITLERVYSIALTNATLRASRSAIDLAMSLLRGDSVPAVEADLSSDSGQDISPISLGIQSANIYGNEIHLLTRSGKVRLFRTRSQNFFTASKNMQQQTPDVPDSETPANVVPPSANDGAGNQNSNVPMPAGDTATKIRRMSEWLLANVGRFRYTQGASRAYPERSGATDCSGLTSYAYRKFLGIVTGSWTVGMQSYGRVVWSNTPGNSFGAKSRDLPPLSIMAEGDLVFFGWKRVFRRVNHVEYYLGGNRLIGHGGPGRGPTIKPDATKYMKQAYYIVVRRYV